MGKQDFHSVLLGCPGLLLALAKMLYTVWTYYCYYYYNHYHNHNRHHYLYRKMYYGGTSTVSDTFNIRYNFKHLYHQYL